MNRPFCRLRLKGHFLYDYGGDTGPCTSFDEEVIKDAFKDEADYDEMLKAIDAFAEELREKVKFWKR